MAIAAIVTNRAILAVSIALGAAAALRSSSADAPSSLVAVEVIAEDAAHTVFEVTRLAENLRIVPSCECVALPSPDALRPVGRVEWVEVSAGVSPGITVIGPDGSIETVTIPCPAAAR